MKTRRTQYEIFWEILQFCKTKKTTTPIIHHCNLNSKIVQDYLEFLIRKNYLIKKQESGKIFYQTTKESEEFLTLFAKLYVQLFEKSIKK